MRLGIPLDVETALRLEQITFLKNGKAPQMSSLDPNPDSHFESELARRRALYCLHDAGRILSDATSFFFKPG